MHIENEYHISNYQSYCDNKGSKIIVWPHISNCHLKKKKEKRKKRRTKSKQLINLGRK